MGLFDDIGSAIGDAVSGAEHLAGQVVDGAAHVTGDALQAVGLDGAARTVDNWGDHVADDLGDAIAEKQLGQTTDPTQLIHGDVAAIFKTSDELGQFATGFAETAHGLSAVDSTHWQGDAADAFRAKYTPQPKKWQDAYDACNNAADALSTYGQTVKSAQGQAKQAIDLYTKGQQATASAQSAHQKQVDDYNTAAQAYNTAVSAGQNPGTPPTQPGPFTDPGAAQRTQAQDMLNAARSSRDAAAAQAQAAISGATALAPAKPSLGAQVMDDVSDTVEGFQIGTEHFVGGIVKGTAGIVDFVRGLDPFDPYNVTHPAEYVDGLSNTAAGLVHLSMHPTQIVPALLGTGWGSDPFEAAGNLVPNIALAVASDGAGAAEDAAASAAEDGAEAGARDLAGAAEDTTRSPEDTVCEDDPVDVASGGVLLPQSDLELPGLLPLTVQRTHLSGHQLGQWFGPTWASTVDQRIVVDADGVLFVAADGVVLHYPLPGADAPVLPSHGARLPLAAVAEGGYTVTDPRSGRTLHFTRPAGGGSWPITAITDRTGSRISFRYDNAGAPAEIHHHGGYRVRVSVEGGRVTALRLTAAADGEDVEIVRYGYTDGHLTEVINSSGQPMRFSYDHAARLTGWTDRNGVWYRYTYDSHGRCVRTESADGALSGTFDYDPDQRVTVHTDGLGGTTRYEYDECRRVIATTDPLGNVTRSEYDEWGNLVTRIDPLGRTTRWEYDAVANPVRVTRPDGTQAIAEYDDRHQLTVMVDPDGATWRYQYDEQGHRTVLIDPLGHRTLCRYDERGHLAAITDPTGRTSVIDTDPVGLPVALTDAAGGITRYRRDAFGRVIEQVDATDATTHYSWTVEGKLASRTDPEGATERWSYDGEGNEIEYVDALGQTTRTEYTHFDLRSAVVGPDGDRLEYGYDSQLRRTSVTNPQGLVWRYEYDAAGRLISETDFDSRILRYTHDAAGQVIERINGVGQVVGYRYDAVGNLVEQRSGDDIAHFSYDPADRLVYASDADSEVSVHRDPLGRVIAETVNGRTVSISYDEAGRRVRRRTPAGVESVWEYDQAGNPQALHTAGHSLTYTHDSAGREIERRLGESFLLAQTWNATGRMAGQTLVGGALHPTTGHPAAGEPDLHVLQRRAYRYRADGYLAGLDDQLSGTRRFELDPAGRVTAVVGEHHYEQYRYDSGGNLSHAVWPAPAHMPNADALGARDYTGTLIRTAGGIRYQHDQQHRVVLRQQRRLSSKDWIWRYTWDANDRLVAVVTPDGSYWRYRYDPLGRRIAKQRLAADHATVLEQVDFTWDGSDLVEQVHDSVHTVTWDYQHGRHIPVTQTERTLPTGPGQPGQDWYDQRFYAIVTDLVGMPTELVDPHGELAWHRQTTLWGAALEHLVARASTPLRFPGQYFDPETDLHYNYHRYYDPATARYVSHDPLGLIPAPNPVTYVHNPYGWIDPLGLANCNIRVSPAYQDWGTKGAHLHIDGAEVRVYPDGSGGIGADGIRLSNGNLASPKQVQQVLDALHSDPGLRADLISKARAAMNDMNAGAYGMSSNRAAEMNFLIKALEKMG